MAQSAQSLQFICRSCRHTLSRSSPQIRQFSNTTSRSKSIPSFTPTSNPELDALFLDWRNRVFTPAALSKHHTSLIYKKKHKPLLENDPGVSVTMSNDEEIKLEPMERWDRPNVRKNLKSLTDMLSEGNDIKAWQNLPAFLEGLKMAGQNVPDFWLEKITRKANELGRGGVIKRCAEMSQKTGLRLSCQGVTRETMFGYHARAAAAEFKGEEISAIAKEAESFALLLEKPEHCARQLGDREVDMRKSLVVVGALLELSAAKVIDVDGADTSAVSSYAKKLIALGKEDVLQKSEKPNSSYAIEDYIPIANGIKLALDVKNVNLSAQEQGDSKSMLQTLQMEIQTLVPRVTAEAKGKQRRAMIMLDKVSVV